MSDQRPQHPGAKAMEFELPARAMFDFSVPVQALKGRISIDGSLDDWPPSFRLPDLAAIDGTPGFAAVYMAWDKGGLYFALDVASKAKVVCHGRRPHKGDALFLWVDTRDVRDALRAGRFCHHFIATPRGSGPGGSQAKAWQAPIHRAREQAPIGQPSQLHVASSIRQGGYALELALPAEVLNGYDPDECARLGLTYMITDVDHGQQLWNVPPHLPFGHDPSTWAAIELTE
jgi:hypothetical protein